MLRILFLRLLPWGVRGVRRGLGAAWLGLAPLTLAAQVAPTITAQPPALLAVDPDTAATFTVGASGTAPLSYQWLKNGAPISGAIAATYVIPYAEYGADFGTYSVIVSNAAGAVTSTGSDLRINSAPYIVNQPASLSATPATVTVTFSCFALGYPTPSLQWLKNGTAIPGATDLTLTLHNVTAADGADYALRATNSFGTVLSDAATLTITSGLVLTQQPTGVSRLVGEAAQLSVYATPDGVVTYRWQERHGPGAPWTDLSDGGVYEGVHRAFLQLIGVTLAMNGNQYRCIATNARGTETSNPATLTVRAFAFSGAYFGDIDGGGHWAMDLSDSRATFLAYLPDRHSAIVQRIRVEEDGRFASGVAELGATQAKGAPAGFSADAVGTTSGGGPLLTGQISASGTSPGGRTVTGYISGIGKNFTGEFRAGNGSQTMASGDFYAAVALNGRRGQVYAVIGYGGDALAVVVVPGLVDGAVGVLGSTGPLTSGASVTTAGGAALSLRVDGQGHALKASFASPAAGAGLVEFLGLGGTASATSRLANVSVRARGGSGDRTLILGFILAGPDPKPLLLRGVGPTLADYGVAGVMTDPRLRLYGANGGLLEENDDWGGTGALRAQFAALGAFALPEASKDAAISASLTRANYSVHLGNATGPEGVALVEAYDAEASRTTRLVNVSARNFAGTGADALLAGFIITGNAPVRLLIRGVGPTLADYNVSGTLADPKLTVFDRTSRVIVENDNWGGTDELVTAFGMVGAFGFKSADSKDSAVILTLAPGTYSAQLSGAGGATGVGLIEIYELP